MTDEIPDDAVVTIRTKDGETILSASGSEVTVRRDDTERIGDLDGNIERQRSLTLHLRLRRVLHSDE